MRKLIVLIALFTCEYGMARPISLAYTFQRNDSASILVTLTIKNIQSAQFTLKLPDEWAGQKELYGAVSGIKVIQNDAILSATDNPAVYTISGKANSDVTVQYLLSRDWKSPLLYPMYFRPVILRDIFYFEGYSGLVYPAIDDDRTEIQCSISYEGFPSDDFLGNSFFSGKKRGSFTSTLSNIRNGVYCGGKYRYHVVTDKGNKIAMAVAGRFTFTDSEVYKNISAIINIERAFWKDKKHPYFFTVLIPTDEDFNSGGTAHYHSFALFQGTKLGMHQSVYLIAHEYFHTWLGQGLRMPAPEEAYKWFSEGFTDYHTYKILLKSGIYDKQQFLDKINEVTRDYYSSAYFTTASAALEGKYWNNPGLKTLSYQRGLILAFLLDYHIAYFNKTSLDELLLELYRRSKPGMLFSETLFENLTAKYADTAIVNTIRHVNEGNNDDILRSFHTVKGLDSKLIVIDKIFDIGFDMERTRASMKITGLKKGSAAEQAGLAEGMEITGNFSIWNNRTDKNARVQVVKDGKKAVVEYLPVTTVHLEVPQVTIRE